MLLLGEACRLQEAFRCNSNTHNAVVVQQGDLGSDVEVFAVHSQPAFILEG